MVAAYCIYSLSIKLGFNPVLSMLVAVIAVTLLGLLAYKFLIEPIREHEGAVLIATIALAMILSGGHPADFHRGLPERQLPD